MLDQGAGRVAHVHVVDVRVALAQAFGRVHDQAALPGSGGRVGEVEPLYPGRQQRRVRHAALDGVHERVARAGVAGQQVAGQEPAEPGHVAALGDLGHAAGRGQLPVAEQPLEPAALEEH